MLIGMSGVFAFRRYEGTADARKLRVFYDKLSKSPEMNCRAAMLVSWP
jgi:hypothetical protein